MSRTWRTPLASGSGRRAGIALGIALLAAFPYLAAGLGNSFIALDDAAVLVDNPLVNRGLTAVGVWRAITEAHASNWYPLTWISHMAVVSLAGMDPWWHHAANVALHALTSALLFVALLRLTGRAAPSALVAALFGVHPLRVESVAWVTERSDVLAGLCFALVLLAYERYARKGGAARLLAVAALLALGLCAKPILVTVPFVLLLLDWWPLGRVGRPSPGATARVLLEKAPLLLLAAASSAATVLAQRSGGSLQDTQVFTPAVRAANAVVSYATYLVQTVRPAGLAVFYPHAVGRHAPAVTAGAGLLLLGLTAFALLRRRAAPAVAVGWLVYLGMLLPLIGLVQVGGQAHADRFTYLPHIGLLLAAVWAVPRGGPRRATATAIAVAAVLLCVLLSARQAALWRDSETLLGHAIAVTRDNWLAHRALARELLRQGRAVEAIPHLNEVVRIEAHDRMYGLAGETRVDLGAALLATGRVAAAVGALREAIAFAPGSAPARLELGRALSAAGDLAGAADAYRAALALAPRLEAAHANLGAVLTRQGSLGDAMGHFRAALELRPDFPEARANLAVALLLAGRAGEAVEQCGEVLRVAPAFFPARVTLARSLVALGRPGEAAAAYRAALALRPEAAEVARELADLGGVAPPPRAEVRP